MLKKKSESSLLSAELLNNNGCSNSSVHCSYFSCFQLLKFSLSDFFGITEEEILAADRAKKDLARSAGRELKVGSHEILINYVVKEIEQKVGPEASGNINDKLNLLKKLRVESDYTDKNIDIDKSMRAYQMAVDVRKELKKILHV